MPDELTMVELHSYDDDSRMYQEFLGRIEDQTRIRELVSQRLGPGVTQWRIVEATVLRVKI